MITREAQDGSCGKVSMVYSMVSGLWSVTCTVENNINSMTNGNSTTFHNPGEHRQNISHQCARKDVSMLMSWISLLDNEGGE